MPQKKYSHVKIRKDGVTFAGAVRKAGDVVAVMTEGMESLPLDTIQAISEIVELTNNQYALFDAGTVNASEFVSLAVGEGDKVVADPVPYVPAAPVLPEVDEEPVAEVQEA